MFHDQSDERTTGGGNELAVQLDRGRGVRPDRSQRQLSLHRESGCERYCWVYFRSHDRRSTAITGSPFSTVAAPGRWCFQNEKIPRNSLETGQRHTRQSRVSAEIQGVRSGLCWDHQAFVMCDLRCWHFGGSKLAPACHFQDSQLSLTFPLSSSGGGLPGRPGFARIRTPV